MKAGPLQCRVMSIPQRELIAALADGRFHSGNELGAKWSVSRAAISKAIKRLSTLGLDVCSVKGKGYRLDERITVLEREKILSDLDEKYQKRLFERYFQVPTDGQNKSGSGLGIAISKDFIEAEDGKIWVVSAIGEGSKFCFSLPVVE